MTLFVERLLIFVKIAHNAYVSVFHMIGVRKVNNNQTLLSKIYSKRKEMIEIGLTKGLSSYETVKCSQELDDLLNLLRQQKKEIISEIAV